MKEAMGGENRGDGFRGYLWGKEEVAVSVV